MVTQQQIDEILELTKLDNTIDDISKKVSLTRKEVIKVLIDNNSKTMIGLKQSITKDLKVIQSEKLMDEREKLVEEINKDINTMYDNFKWVADNLIDNCQNYFNCTLGTQIDNPTDKIIKKLMKSIKREDSLVIIELDLQLTPNEIIQHLIYINKNKKTTISKRLTKLHNETKKDKRKLIRLDIEDVVDDMYSVYKWFVFDYETCIEYMTIDKELELEEKQLLKEKD